MGKIMENKSGACWVVSFAPCAEMPGEISAFLEEYFDVVAVDYTDDGLEQYKGYKNAAFDEADLLAEAGRRSLSLPPYDKEFLQSDNWLKDYVIKFNPVEAGDFLIYGIHEKEAPKTDKLALRVYAATAFGSEHQTTKSCLEAISFLNRLAVPCARILDMGTGSGILALACAKLWKNKTYITAVDIDEEAVWVTRRNAEDNGLQDFITAAVSNGYASSLVGENAPYDVIISNILARPLIEMAPDLYQCLAPGGYCILSGFVEDQEDWVVRAHAELGLSPVKTYKIDNWRAVVMEKRK